MIPGSVITLGIILCSKSIKVTTISEKRKIKENKDVRDIPNLQTKRAETTPERSSTTKYVGEILEPQALHLPRRMM